MDNVMTDYINGAGASSSNKGNSLMILYQVIIFLISEVYTRDSSWPGATSRKKFRNVTPSDFVSGSVIPFSLMVSNTSKRRISSSSPYIVMSSNVAILVDDRLTTVLILA